MPWAALSGLLAICFVAGQAWLQQGWIAAGPINDFLTFYSAAGAADLYAPAAIEAAWPEALAGLEQSSRPYARLPVHATLFAPLRLLPYPTAYQVFQVLMLWSMAAFVSWWLPEKRAWSLLFTAISLPLFFSFMRGQDLPLALLAAAACTQAVRKEKPFLAGLCLSLAAVHPQALLAAPLVILAQRGWALGAGLGTGLCALASASFAYAGLDWPQRFVAAWAAAAPAEPAAMPNLAGAALWLGLDPLAALGAGLALAGAVYTVSSRESFTVSLGSALAAGMLIAPQAHLEDTVLLLPAALALALGKQPWPVRLAAALVLLPFGFLLQGGEPPVPVLVGLSLLTVLLAGFAPAGRSAAPSRSRFIQLELG